MSDQRNISSDQRNINPDQRNLMSDQRNISLFMVAISSTASCLYYQYALTMYGPNEWGQSPLDILRYYLLAYALIDGVFCSTYELKLHHLFIVGLFYCDYYHDNPQDRMLFLYPLVKTEVSSIFYVLKNWLPENSLSYNLNLALFYLSFMKFRVYDMYVELIHQNTVFDILRKKGYSSYVYGIYVSVYGLYLLNLYWSMILNKMLYKTVSSFLPINTDKVCYSMCRIAYLFHIPLVFTLHPQIYNCIGTSIMSVSAYLYHTDVYQQLKYKHNSETIETSTNTNIYSYSHRYSHRYSYGSPSSENVLYTVSIQIRLFFAVFSYASTSHILFSLMSHLFTIYRCIHHFSKNVDDIHFLRDQRRILAVPFFVDGMLICMATQKEIIPMFLLYSTMVLLHVLTPFYKLTPFSISLGMLAQTYIISK